MFVFIYFYLNFYFIQCEAWGENIVSGLAESSTSKDSQAKTTEPMVSTKSTNCSIQSRWILGLDISAKNSAGSLPEAKMCDFFI